MNYISLLGLLLNAGVIAGPIHVADADSSHHQVCLKVAMRNDGSFAVAWVDSLRIPAPVNQESKTNIYIRFFDADGKPLGEVYKLPKLVDSNWVYDPCLDMDSAGNTILIWREAPIRLSTYWDIRYQRFSFGKAPTDVPKTLKSKIYKPLVSIRAFHADLNQKDELALAWGQIVWDSFFREQIWVQRFNYQGEALDSAFMAHSEKYKDSRYAYKYPSVAINDKGYIVVTWVDRINTIHEFPRMQVFSPDDELLYYADSIGRRVDENPDTIYGASHLEPHWLDEDRFVVFWPTYCSPWRRAILLGRVFSNRGLTAYSERIIVQDERGLSTSGNSGEAGVYSTSVSGDNFVFTSSVVYRDTSSNRDLYWNHCGGVIGEVKNNQPVRRTNYFEYTPKWYPDTMHCIIDYVWHTVIPAVACNKSRIVWVYPRFNKDTIFEAYALITDWDMGVGVGEFPVISTSNWQLVSSVGHQIVLQYADMATGFHASIFDASGCKVDELHASSTSGTVSWGSSVPSGVYFIRELSTPNPSSAHKVVLIR